MLKRSLKVVLFVLLPLQAHAQFTDFEDLTLGTTFPVASTINSNGLSFDVVLYGSFGSPIEVSDRGDANGSGLELSLPNTIGLDFQLLAGTQQISLLYGGFCCESGVTINGFASTLNAGLSPLNGTSLGGVSIAVSSSSVPGGEQGEAIFTGPITSFVIGGTEFAVDDVNVVVPEPSATVLLLTCMLTLAAGLGRKA